MSVIHFFNCLTLKIMVLVGSYFVCLFDCLLFLFSDPRNELQELSLLQYKNQLLYGSMCKYYAPEEFKRLITNPRKCSLLH